jgi:Secretion system C-terminal sorting domain
LFPNPTLRYLKVNTTEILPNATLKIYTTSGQLVSEIIDTKKMFPIEIDLGDLTPGIYILKIESNGMILSERFVKK